MKKLFRTLLPLLVLVSVLVGCSATPSSVSKGKAKKLADSVSYVKDYRTGLCYAVVSSRIYALGFIPSQQKGLGLTQVPCEDCKDQLIN